MTYSELQILLVQKIKDSGLKDYILAQKVGVDNSEISKFIRSRKKFGIKVLNKIANYFELVIDFEMVDFEKNYTLKQFEKN